MTEFFDVLTTKESTDDITNKFRHVFINPLGIEVLTDILINFCHFLIPAKNMEQVAEQKVGLLILGRLGIISGGNEIEAIRALASVMPKQKKEE